MTHNKPPINETRSLIKQIEEKRDSKVIIAMMSFIKDDLQYLELTEIVRNIGQTNKLDVLFWTPGGDGDISFKMALMLKQYCKEFTVVVPSRAISAGTFFALWADKLVMSKSGVLGPVDPKVRISDVGWSSQTKLVPNTLKIIENLSDKTVKKTLANNLPATELGFLVNATSMPKEMLNAIFDHKGYDEKKKERLSALFVDKYTSHYYPFTRKFLHDNGIETSDIPDDIEDKFFKIHLLWRKWIASETSDSYVLQSSDSETIHPNLACDALPL